MARSTRQSRSPAAPAPAPPDGGETPAAAALSDEGHSEFVTQLLDKAKDLRDQKAALFQMITKNRRSLRDLRDQDVMSERQAASVAAFYPDRDKKDADASDNTPANGAS